MTFDPRARAAQIAKEASDQISGEWPLMMNDLERIVESALIQFAREVLTQDPKTELLKHARQWIENHSDELFASNTDDEGEWSDDPIDSAAKKLHDEYEEWLIQVDSIQENLS